MKLRIALVTVFALMSFSLGSMSCSKKQKSDSDSVTSEDAGESSSTSSNPMGDSDSGKASGLQTVRFPYDSYALDDEAKSVLRSNAATMKKNSGLKIQIEGHCDSRGGTQYNLALGEKRANAARKYILELGVAADRVTTVSYGKEQLLDSGDSEAAHARNRRGNFVITAN